MPRRLVQAEPEPQGLVCNASNRVFIELLFPVTLNLFFCIRACCGWHPIAKINTDIAHPAVGAGLKRWGNSESET